MTQINPEHRLEAVAAYQTIGARAYCVNPELPLVHIIEEAECIIACLNDFLASARMLEQGKGRFTEIHTATQELLDYRKRTNHERQDALDVLPHQFAVTRSKRSRGSSWRVVMATIARSRPSSGGCAGVAIVLAIIAAVVGMIALTSLKATPTQAPGIGDIVTRPHAVEKHGADALKAREGLTACKSISSRVTSGFEGVGWAVWCETNEYLCPGTYVTFGGVEKTAFIRPCTQWRGIGLGDW